jgi:MDMPI C-terminal domain
MTVEPLDVNAGWTVVAGTAGVAVSATSSDDSDLTVFGTAGVLYLWLWNRAADDDVSFSGRLELADVWRERFVVNAR